MFWTFLQPLLTMIVLSMVFSIVFGKGSGGEIVNYPVYLLSGRLLYDFFTQSTKRAMRSIRSNASIIKKVYVPKYIYPLSQVLSTFVTFLISLSVLAVVIAFFNIIGKDPVTITFNVFWAIIPVVILFIFCMGVGMFLATLNVFFRDIENFYDVITLLLFYLVPIVYSVDKLGFQKDAWQVSVLKINPLYGIIEMFRAAVLHGNEFRAFFDLNQLYYTFAVAVVTFVIGFIVFYKNQDKFILHI